jgi:hypothetical protein
MVVLVLSFEIMWPLYLVLVIYALARKVKGIVRRA